MPLVAETLDSVPTYTSTPLRALSTSLLRVGSAVMIWALDPLGTVLERTRPIRLVVWVTHSGSGVPGG